MSFFKAIILKKKERENLGFKKKKKKQILEVKCSIMGFQKYYVGLKSVTQNIAL